MNKIAFGILTILLNPIGVPCFIAGNVKAGVIRIVLWIIPCVGQVIAIINTIMGIIQGIKILKMTDEEFEATDKITLLAGIPSGKPKAEANADAE